MASRLMRIVAIMVTLLVCSPLHAQSKTPDQEIAAKVLRLVKDANDEFDRGEFRDALELYEEAYGLYPDAVLLYRIGLAAEKTGDTRRAVRAYQAFVDAAKSDDATAKKLSARVVELLASLAPQVKITSVPAGADVFIDTIDGRSLGQTPGVFDIPEGDVVLLLRLEGYKLEKRTFTLKNGEEDSADVELEELEGLVTTEPVEPTDEGGISLGTIGWITTGVGVAVLGTGATFAILSSSATSDVNDYDKRAEGANRGELEDLRDKATGLHKTSVATFVVGGLVTAAGATLLIVDMAGRKPEKTSSVAPNFGVGRHGAWVGLFGRF